MIAALIGRFAGTEETSFDMSGELAKVMLIRPLPLHGEEPPVILSLFVCFFVMNCAHDHRLKTLKFKGSLRGSAFERGGTNWPERQRNMRLE